LKQRYGLIELLAYLMTIIIEVTRIYWGFVLNLYPCIPYAKWIFTSIVALCIPLLLLLLWYLRLALETGSNWKPIILSILVILIGLNAIVVSIRWPKTQRASRSWSRM